MALDEFCFCVVRFNTNTFDVAIMSIARQTRVKVKHDRQMHKPNHRLHIISAREFDNTIILTCWTSFVPPSKRRWAYIPRNTLFAPDAKRNSPKFSIRAAARRCSVVSYGMESLVLHGQTMKLDGFVWRRHQTRKTYSAEGLCLRLFAWPVNRVLQKSKNHTHTRTYRSLKRWYIHHHHHQQHQHQQQPLKYVCLCRSLVNLSSHGDADQHTGLSAALPPAIFVLVLVVAHMGWPVIGRLSYTVVYYWMMWVDRNTAVMPIGHRRRHRVCIVHLKTKSRNGLQSTWDNWAPNSMRNRWSTQMGNGG